MSRDLSCATFVCYDDISGNKLQGLNPVIYNPSLKEDTRKCLLSKITYEQFGVKLTDKQLDSLCKYDKYHLSEFVNEIISYIC